ncbi:hypothetical protein LCGC14_0847260, partial [marine sediment metagenome]
CETCKTNIEKAGNLKNMTYLDYDKETEMAMVTYDSTRTNADEILKRVALAGYDNEKYYAPDATYTKLGECCQYERGKPVAPENHNKVSTISDDSSVDREQHGAIATENTKTLVEGQDSDPLQKTFDTYFGVKDAMVKTDGNTASAKAGKLLASLKSIKMESLEMNVHRALMKVLEPLTADAKSISESKDITEQRNLFKALSKNMYEVIKISGPDATIYYQYCPMQDANWLSMESAVKNPYYGSQMMGCGSTVETIEPKN